MDDGAVVQLQGAGVDDVVVQLQGAGVDNVVVQLQGARVDGQWCCCLVTRSWGC